MTKKTTNKDTSAEALLRCIVDAIEEKKGNAIVSLAIGELPNAVCKYFVICDAESTIQVDAIAQNVEERVHEKLKEKVYRSAGYENSIWIVLDYVDIVVHVFQTEWREYYKIEDLWGDAKVVSYGDNPESSPYQMPEF